MRRFWQGLSVRYKLTSVIVLIILLVTVTITPIVTFLIKDALLVQQDELMEAARQIVLNIFYDYEEKLQNYAALFSNNQEIKEALLAHADAAKRGNRPLKAVRRLYRSFDVSMLVLYDKRGHVLAAAETPEGVHPSKSEGHHVSSALAGNPTSGLYLTKSGFVIRAWAPVLYSRDRIIGVVSAGVILNKDILSRIRQMTGANILLLDEEDRIVSSTVIGDMPPGALAAEEIPGFRIMKFPLEDRFGRSNGRVLIMHRNNLSGILRRIHAILLAVLLTILAVTVASVYLMSKRLTMPILHLKDGAERIGKGDFGVRVDVQSRDEIGRLAEVFNIMSSNLERLRHVEERLLQSERLASVGRFAAGIAHEINNPIGNIIGIARLMQKTAEDKEVKEDISSIIKNADRCAKIVKDLLAYSRQSPPRKEWIDVPLFIEEAIGSVNRYIGPGVSVLMDIPPGLPRLYADPLQLSQALGNIIMNAVQSISGAGSVTIQASYLHGDFIEITVADTGCGIDNAVRDKIFDPFFTTKSVGEGTGLGLAISYGIVKNHDGEITVESKKGEGSRFRIRLPIRRA